MDPLEEAAVRYAAAHLAGDDEMQKDIVRTDAVTYTADQMARFCAEVVGHIPDGAGAAVCLTVFANRLIAARNGNE